MRGTIIHPAVAHGKRFAAVGTAVENGLISTVGPPSHESPSVRPRRVLLVVGVGTLLGALAGSAGNIALPDLARDLGLSVDLVGWTVTAFLLTSTVLMLLAGRIGDIVGHRTIYLAGFAVMAATSVVCGLTQSFVVLVAARAVQGIGGAMVMAAGPALITTSYPGNKRGGALGMLGTATYTGLTIGPMVGGTVVSALSWRWLFFLYVPFAVAVMVLGVLCLPSGRRDGERLAFDWAGAATLVTGLPLLLYAVTQGNALGWTSPPVIVCAAAGVALLAVFGWVEAHEERPMLDLRLFQSRVFSGAVLSAVGNYVAQFVVVILLPFYLIEALALPPVRAGMLVSTQALVMAVVTSPSGRLSDRIGSRGLATLGLLLLAAAIGGMSTLGPHSTQLTVALWMALAGLGSGVFVSPNSNALMGAAPRSQQGIASAVMAVARTLGMILGVALATAVYQAAGGATGRPWTPTDYAALRVALLVATGVCLLSAGAAALRGGARS